MSGELGALGKTLFTATAPDTEVQHWHLQDRTEHTMEITTHPDTTTNMEATPDTTNPPTITTLNHDLLQPQLTPTTLTFPLSHHYQYYLDKSTPFVLYRWIALLCVVFIYILRIYFVQGFYVVSYAVGIYILNLLIGFLSPQVDPELQALDDGPTLPVRASDEFRPFVRRLPEFKFWCVSLIVLNFLYGFVGFLNNMIISALFVGNVMLIR